MDRLILVVVTVLVVVIEVRRGGDGRCCGEGRHVGSGQCVSGGCAGVSYGDGRRGAVGRFRWLLS